MQPCLFSISYGGLWGQATLDLSAFVAKAAALGYRAVMLAGKRPHLSPLDYSPERISELKAVLDRHDVSCPIVAAYTDFAGMPAAEVPAVEMQVAYVESLCRIGRELGASIVRVFTAYETEN
jgi:sugar phosphate isomerase/epimerase